MRELVERGLKTQGVLPGYIRLKRKAMSMHQKALEAKEESDRFLLLLDAFALAGGEENGAGHRVVTAPTNGSAGVIPALIYLLEEHFSISEEKIFEGLIAAACIGFVAKQNASISGAEVGCQGEIGVAASMGAALLVQVFGYSVMVMDHAAEIALEHNLGLTCDPIGGYVQIPCIERNAVGALDAYNAYLLASAEKEGQHKISYDEVLKVMLETGKDMSSKYKETSKGGLAKCKFRCISC
jgi:L-serine dehydratase